jgi:hypothetical protein
MHYVDIMHTDKIVTRKALALTSVIRAPKVSSKWRKHWGITVSSNKDGDRIQSPESCILNKKTGRWTTSSYSLYVLQLVWDSVHPFNNGSTALSWVLAAFFSLLTLCTPITVVAQSNAWTAFAGSNAGIVGSNHTEGMDVCIVWVYSVFVLFCV